MRRVSSLASPGAPNRTLVFASRRNTRDAIDTNSSAIMYPSERRVCYDVRTRYTLVHMLARLTIHIYCGHTSYHLIGVTSVFTGITQSTEKKEYCGGRKYTSAKEHCSTRVLGSSQACAGVSHDALRSMQRLCFVCVSVCVSVD